MMSSRKKKILINKIILASTSIARKQILEKSLGFSFDIEASNILEDSILGVTPEKTALERAKAKAYHVASQKKKC